MSAGISVVVVARARVLPGLRETLTELGPPYTRSTALVRSGTPLAAVVADARAAAPSRGVLVIAEHDDEVDAILAEGADEALVEPVDAPKLERALRRAALRAGVRDDHAVEAHTLERVLAGIAQSAESPLASLALDLDGLRSGTLDTLDDFDAALDDCVAATDQVLHLLRNVSVLARTGDSDHREHIPIAPLIESLVDALGGHGGLRAHVEVHAEDDTLEVVAPRSQLARALAGVIVQTLDAVPDKAGAGVRRLRIGVRPLPDAVAISLDLRPALDAPPPSTSFTLRDEGRLAVTRASLRSFDGELFAERASDGGVRFVVFLPRRIIVVSEPALAARLSTPIARPRRPRVLVVDRDARVLRATARALSDRYDVIVAISGEEAISLAIDLAIDVAVIDAHLSEPSADALVHELRRANAALATRVLLTGAAPDAAVAAGAAKTLMRPLSRSALVTAIESLLATMPVAESGRVLN